MDDGGGLKGGRALPSCSGYEAAEFAIDERHEPAEGLPIPPAEAGEQQGDFSFSHRHCTSQRVARVFTASRIGGEVNNATHSHDADTGGRAGNKRER